MRVAWIFPQQSHCGISLYAQRYVAALVKHDIDIDCYDVTEVALHPSASSALINRADVVHVHYETSFFLTRKRDRYIQVMKSIGIPRVVTLHEVYREFPGIFPRDSIAGSALIRSAKKVIYDFRHPVRTAYHCHLRNAFFADRIIVHHRYQSDILNSQGIEKSKLHVIPHAVNQLSQTRSFTWSSPSSRPLRLGSTGFINPHYDYRLLLDTLERLDIPWTFTWIGGLRSEHEHHCKAMLEQEIANRNWQDRFTITGWVPEQQRNDLLIALDIYLALFSNRSTSESLATALGARCLIIATRIPLTSEIEADNHPLLLAEPDTAQVLERIGSIISDSSLRARLHTGLEQYLERTRPERITVMIRKLYRSLVPS